MRRGKQPLRPTQKPGLHFITSDPSSAEGKAEALRAIRSHVGRWTWQQIREKSQQEEPEAINENKDGDCVAADALPAAWSKPSEGVGPLEVEYPPVGPVYPSSSTPYVAWDDSVEALGEGNKQAWVPLLVSKRSIASQEQSDLSLLPPLCSISADNLDPFQTHVPSPIASDLVSSSNKYSLSVLWPGLMPLSWMTGTHAGVQNWFSNSTTHPILHSAMLFGAYSHRRTRFIMKKLGYFGSDDMRQMTLCEADVISQINAVLHDPVRAICDEVILSVLCLATNKYDVASRHEDRESPFHAPLRSLQWLDVYGRLSPNSVHQAGLFQLVYLRGGLEKIELPGLAAVISFSSILGASKSLSQPHFPFISLRSGRQMALQEILEIQSLPLEHGLLLEIGMTTEMYDVFRGLRAYVSLAESFQNGIQDVDNLTLCDNRNLVQWYVMSLLPASQLGPVLLQLCPIYEAFRLALIIFGVGITFPLPADVAPLGNLAICMQLELQTLLDQESPAQNAGLESKVVMQAHCWCLVLGGIAAGTQEQEREWFLLELRRVVCALGLSTWQELRTVLQFFLWWDSVCESAGRQLWIDMNTLPQPLEIVT